MRNEGHALRLHPVNCIGKKRRGTALLATAQAKRNDTTISPLYAPLRR